MRRGLKRLQDRYQSQFNEKAYQVLRIIDFLATILGDNLYAFDLASANLEKYGIKPYIPHEVIQQAIVSHTLNTNQMVVSRDPQREYLAGRFR